MKKLFFLPLLIILFGAFKPLPWGFFAHQRINQQAIFSLPPEMARFFKKQERLLMEYSVNPDQRRYAVADEAPRHYIDLDVYGDSATFKLPHYWPDAVNKIGEDSLKKHGIVPWHIQLMKHQLTEAFRTKDANRIIRISAEIGHYIADAHVPLHTTRNYNGQLTGQEGIHGFWESRLPELFHANYNYFVGKAVYLPSVQKTAWNIVRQSHFAVDSVLHFEKSLTKSLKKHQKYSITTRNNVAVKTFSKEFSKAYDKALNKQVERRFRASILMVASFWYTAWIDAGQPNLEHLEQYEQTQQEKDADLKEQEQWQQKLYNARPE
jgi:hypothetical protein